jgi:hypothetical protein
MVGRTPVSALKANVSCESMEAPEAWPVTVRLAPIRSSAETSIGSIPTPTTTSRPRTARPGITVLIALPLVTVADRLRTAEFHQLRRHVLRLAVKIDMGAELPRQLFLVAATCDSDCAKSHLRGKLHAEMAEAADAENGDEITWPRPAFAQCVVGGDAGAQQRRRLRGRDVIRDQHQRVGRRDHRLGVTAIVIDAGNPQVTAIHEIPAAAWLAPATMAAEPADTDTRPHRPADDAVADRVDHPSDFVPRHDRVGHGGKQPFLGDRIAVADAARLHFDAHFPRPCLRQLPLDQLEGAAFLSHLDSAHFRHHDLPLTDQIQVGSPAPLAIIIIIGASRGGDRTLP